jgi:hypothetical protein
MRPLSSPVTAFALFVSSWTSATYMDPQASVGQSISSKRPYCRASTCSPHVELFRGGAVRFGFTSRIICADKLGTENKRNASKVAPRRPSRRTRNWRPWAANCKPLQTLQTKKSKTNGNDMILFLLQTILTPFPGTPRWYRFIVMAPFRFLFWLESALPICILLLGVFVLLQAGMLIRRLALFLFVE